MDKKILKIVLTVVCFLMIISCSDDYTLSALEETIYIRRNNADMPAYIHGNGTNKIFLVLLHGGPGGNGLEYRGGVFQEELEKDYALVYWDQRGQGMSQGHITEDDISISEMVLDVRALALVLRHKFGSDIKLVLIGHSWGGTLGSSVMVTENQNLFNGWVEIAGAHDLPMLYKSAIAMFKKIGSEQIAEGKSINFWSNIVNKVSLMDTSEVNSDDFSYLNEKAHEAEEYMSKDSLINASDISWETIKNALVIVNPLTSLLSGMATSKELSNKGLDTYSVSDSLHKITIPTLLIWGKYDFVVPPLLGEKAMEKIGAAEKSLVIFDKSGHSPMDNEPHKFMTVIEDFINKL